MKPTLTKRIVWSVVHTECLPLMIAATTEGLCYVAPYEESVSALSSWAKVKCPDYTLQRDDASLLPYARQFIQYLHGDRQQFKLPLVKLGTPFQQDVWKALETIPYGETRTYADIAASLGKPNAVRAVGAAIGANPLLIVIPCHRVIGKNGALTGYRGGLAMKTKLLELEQAIHVQREEASAYA